MNEENLRVVRLAQSPEEFIGEISVIGDTIITINNPYMMVADPSGSKFGLVPWAMFSKSRTFNFRRDQILYIAEPFESLINAYREQVGGIKAVRNAQQIIVPEGT